MQQPPTSQVCTQQDLAPNMHQSAETENLDSKQFPILKPPSPCV